MEVRGKLPIDKSKIKRILVRMTNWVGDAVMTLPALEAVRENFPGSSITVLARPWVVPLVENHPAVDAALPFTKSRGYPWDLAETLRMARQIRQGAFDLAILFQNAFEAAFLARVGGVKYRVGYNTQGRGLLLTHSVIKDEEITREHQVEYYLAILRAMGWEAKSRDPVLHVGQKALDSATAVLASNEIGEDGFLLGLSPGAIYGPAKRWPEERFAAVGDRAAKEWGAKVLVFGSRGEQDVCRAVVRSMHEDALDLSGKTSLDEALALIKKCDFFVTNDSGLMHAAAALEVPLVAVFGSTDAVATGPRGNKSRVVQCDTDCAPCLKPECPDDFRCMLDIEADEVWGAMEKLRSEMAGT